MISAVGLAMTGEDRAQIEPILEASTTRWEARANPLLEDFEDDDPDAALTAWFESAPPYVGTAMAASKTRYCGSDGFCVRAVHAGDACAVGWSEGASESDRGRARFLAWPFAYAILVRVPPEADPRATAETLRAAARRSSQIGLIIAGTDADAQREEPYATLGEHWRQHESWKFAASADGGAGDGEGEARAVFPAHLDRKEVLVLPRFEALRTGGALLEEVRRLAPNTRVSDHLVAN